MKLVDEVWVIPVRTPDAALAAVAAGRAIVVVGRDPTAVGELLRQLPGDARQVSAWLLADGFDGLREMLAELHPGAEVVVPGGGKLDEVPEKMW